MTKVSPGQLLQISAGTWNDLLDVRKLIIEQQLLGSGGSEQPRRLLSALPLTIKNNTGGNLARGKSVNIGDLIVDDFESDGLWFNGDDLTDAGDPYAITAEAIPDGDIGQGYVYGFCVASVNVSNTTHGFATIAEGSADLSSGTGGDIRILNALTSTGVQECVVFLGGTVGKKRLVRFTLDAALATTDASKAATIVEQFGPGADADTAEAITVYNLAASSDYVFEGDEDDVGLALWDSEKNYRIIQMECP